MSLLFILFLRFYVANAGIGECCESLVMNSSGTAGGQHPELMGLYKYENMGSNGYNEYKGPNNNHLYYLIDHKYWFVETLPSVDRFIVSDFCNKTCPEACDKNWTFYNKYGIYEVDPDLSVSCASTSKLSTQSNIFTTNASSLVTPDSYLECFTYWGLDVCVDDIYISDLGMYVDSYYGKIVQCQMNDPKLDNYGDSCSILYAADRRWHKMCRLKNETWMGMKMELGCTSSPWGARQCTCQENLCNQRFNETENSTLVSTTPVKDDRYKLLGCYYYDSTCSRLPCSSTGVVFVSFENSIELVKGCYAERQNAIGKCYLAAASKGKKMFAIAIFCNAFLVAFISITKTCCCGVI